MLSTGTLQLLRSPVLWVPALIVAVSLTLHFMVPGALDTLAYERNLLFVEPWRILGAHFVHLNTLHLLTNLLAFVVICALFRAFVSGRMLLNVVLFSAIFACLLPWAADQQLSFAGLSGVLHGIVMYAAVQMLRAKHRWGYGVLGILFAKLVFEMTLASGDAGWLGAEVAYYSHLGGALGGALAVPGLRRNKSR